MQSDNHMPAQKGSASSASIEIELLAIDLNTCTRCVGTLENIEKAIDMVHPILEVISGDATVAVRKTIVASAEQARQLEFATSPTIRINGRDIVFEALESQCDSCTDLCGCDEGTTCRVWTYRGQEYTEAPVGLIVEAILDRIIIKNPQPQGEVGAYSGVPENLQRFFEGLSGKETTENPCCSPSVKESCCEPNQKSACCQTPETETCGCR
jgi:hypothetical protein